jgi:Lactate racemase N-terminal domain
MMTLPRQSLVAPPIERHALPNPSAAIREHLDATWVDEPWTGKRVAVAVGSRGIDRIAEIVSAVVEWLRARGATPFVMPAMGSHGGATPDGQRGILATYGVTEAAVAAVLETSMDVSEIGQTRSGVHVVTSSVALAADAVVLVNRVKPHTDFDSAAVGSGLVKMSAIGLGKAEGAFRCHWAAATFGHEQVIGEVSDVVLARLPRVYGVALLEDGAHRLSRVELLKGEEIRRREPELLRVARRWMPSLPLAEVDVLIVDEIGKNISGTGMDTNIVGRGVDLRPMDNCRSVVRAIYLRSLTPESHGNAVGLGLADIVSTRLVEQMDLVATYTNAVSAMTPSTARIPIHFRTDAECLAAALRVAAADPVAPRIARIRNTLALDRVVLSEACLPALADTPGVEVLVPPTPWRFDAGGSFDQETDLLIEVPSAGY